MKKISLTPQYTGIFFGAAAAVSYGLNPFFGIPLYDEGLKPLSVLFYRFIIAALMLACVMFCRKESFKLPRQYWLHTFGAGLMLGLTCLFWFLSFRIMDSGIAATILFIYPVMVALIMLTFYKERLDLKTASGIILAIAGVILLCQPGSGGRINLEGIVYILLSALTYAIYIVGVKQSRLANLPPGTLTFYALLFAVPIFLIPLRMGADLQMLHSAKTLFYTLGLALIPSLCAFLFTALAIRRIGPTRAAVMGALEPVTALTAGIFVFHEPITWKILAGIIIIITAVTIVIKGCTKAPEKP